MKSIFYIKGNICPSCTEKISNKINNLDYVEKAEINIIEKKVIINHSEGEILRDVRKIFKIHEPDVIIETEEKEENISKVKIDKDMMILSASIILYIAGLLSKGNIKIFMFISAYLVSGFDVFIRTLKSIKGVNFFNENFLMTVATIGAAFMGEFNEAAAVMIFYKIGESLEDKAQEKSRRSIKKLLDLKPSSATVVVDHKQIKVKPEEIKIGDIILLKLGERVPVDGVIVKGSGSFDTKAVTGESKPLDISEGDEVYSGYINSSGVILMKALKSYEKSLIYKIIELVQNYSKIKSKAENFITKFARVYTPIVIILAAIIGILIPLINGGSFRVWVYRGLIFLAASCPCALILSVPLSYFAGIGKSAGRGILIKGSNYLDELTKVKIISFDKTGTLTLGKLKVEGLYTNYDRDELLRFVFLCEYYSNHPLALAVKESFKAEVEKDKILDYKEIPGKGIYMNYDGKNIYSGNKKLMDELNIKVDFNEEATAIHIAVDGNYYGTITFRDSIRKESFDTISKLRKMGIKPVMLTGDNETEAANTALELNIDEYYSGLLPEDKVKKIEMLKSKGVVAFVGDGINDAPVIVSSNIGISMGGVGQDAAVEASDIVLVEDRLDRLVEVFKIAFKTKRIVYENIIFALGVKTIVLILAALGYADMWLAVFADVGVTLITVLNSLRVLKGSLN